MKGPTPSSPLLVFQQNTNPGLQLKVPFVTEAFSKDILSLPVVPEGLQCRSTRSRALLTRILSSEDEWAC